MAAPIKKLLEGCFYSLHGMQKTEKMAEILCPYFDTDKSQLGLLKSTGKYVLATLLHLQLYAPLLYFEKHLHLA